MRGQCRRRPGTNLNEYETLTLNASACPFHSGKEVRCLPAPSVVAVRGRTWALLDRSRIGPRHHTPRLYHGSANWGCDHWGPDREIHPLYSCIRASWLPLNRPDGTGKACLGILSTRHAIALDPRGHGPDGYSLLPAAAQRRAGRRVRVEPAASSRPSREARHWLATVRVPRGIGNGLHGSLDAAFREGASRLRTGHAPATGACRGAWLSTGSGRPPPSRPGCPSGPARPDLASSCACPAACDNPPGGARKPGTDCGEVDRGISWTSQAVVPVCREVPGCLGTVFGAGTGGHRLPVRGFAVRDRKSGRHAGRDGRAAGWCGLGGGWQVIARQGRAATGSAGRRRGRAPVSGSARHGPRGGCGPAGGGDRRPPAAAR